MKRRLSNKKMLLPAGVLGLVYLALLIYLKYDLNGIPLKEFRFDYIGNILNVLITFLLLSGSILIKYSKTPIDNKNKYFLFTLLTLSIIMLVCIWLIDNADFLKTDKIIFNFPVRKVYIGFFYILSFFLQLYSMVYIWGFIFGKESLFELRSLVRSIIAIVILMFFSLVIVWNVYAFSDSKIGDKKFKYGFIPGAAVYSKGKPSPIFEARIRKALELYRKNVIKEIILTGGHAPGEISEAEAAQKYLINLGVNKKRIIFENRSSTTAEQINYLRKNFSSPDDKDSVLVISDGFHLTRTIQIAKFYNFNALGVASDYSLSFEKTIFYRTRESIALLMFWLFTI